MRKERTFHGKRGERGVTLFVALLTLMAMALCFYVCVVGLERFVLASRRRV